MNMFDRFFTSFDKLVNDTFKSYMGTGNVISPQDYNKLNKLDKKTKTLFLNFFKIGDTKKDIIKELDEIKNFYFSQLIINRIVEDALAPNSNSELFQISVKDYKGKEDTVITNHLRDFNDNMNIKKILMDIAHDILLYGEYALRLDTIGFSENSAKKGIVNIHDDVDLTNLIPVYKDGGIGYFLTMKNKKLVMEQPTKYAYFILPGNRIKVKIDGEDDKVLYLRMGKSILFPVFGLLKELKFFEDLIPLQFVKSFFKTKLLGVSVPNKVKPSEAIDIANTYQKLINGVLLKDLPDDNDAMIEELKKRAGDVKVIPNFDNKGQLEEIDIGTNDKYDDVFEKINDIRKNILTTIGIPASIIDDGAGMKSDIIKDNIRYTKKLKTLQESLIEGLRDLYIIHLHNTGFTTVRRKDIQINFLNILDTNDLEKLEFLDLQISMLDNFKSFIEDIKDDDNIELNEKQYVEFMNGVFEKITGFEIFRYKEKKKDNI